MRLVPLLPLLLVAACAAFPALDTRMDAADLAAPYPALVPLGPILAQAGAAAPPPAAAGLDGRLAALSARAAALRRPVIDAAARARMADSLR